MDLVHKIVNLIVGGYNLILSLVDAFCAEKLLLLLRIFIAQAHALRVIPFITFVTLYVKHVRIQRLVASAKGLPLMVRWL